MIRSQVTSWSSVDESEEADDGGPAQQAHRVGQFENQAVAAGMTVATARGRRRIERCLSGHRQLIRPRSPAAPGSSPAASPAGSASRAARLCATPSRTTAGSTADSAASARARTTGTCRRWSAPCARARRARSAARGRRLSRPARTPPDIRCARSESGIRTSSRMVSSGKRLEQRLADGVDRAGRAHRRSAAALRRSDQFLVVPIHRRALRRRARRRCLAVMINSPLTAPTAGIGEVRHQRAQRRARSKRWRASANTTISPEARGTSAFSSAGLPRRSANSSNDDAGRFEWPARATPCRRSIRRTRT